MLLFILVHTLIQTTHAQTKNDKGDLYANCPAYLDCAQKLADDEKTRIIGEAAQLKHRSEGFLPCDEDRLAFEQDYINWFLTYKSEIRKVYDALNIAIDLQRQKLASIYQQTVNVNPLPNQTAQTTVVVNLQMIKDYLIQLNGRLKTCPNNQVDLLMKGIENPEWNEPSIAHSQVQTAIDQINAIVSASLQQQDVVSKIVFSQSLNSSVRTAGYAMNLVLETKYKDATLLSLDLFKNEETAFTESQKWAFITASKIQINDLPIDGARRYAEMQKKRTSQCALDDSSIKRCPSQGVPFVTFGSLPR